MALITNNRELINEWTVESIFGFLSRPEWLEAFCKRHPEYNPDDASCDILNHITSDEDEIRDILEEDNRLWSVEYITGSKYSNDYFLIQQWENTGEEE